MQQSLKFLSVVVLAFTFCQAVAVPNPAPEQVAQGEPNPPSPSYQEGPDEGRVNHIVTVAKRAHQFDPTQINATIGDTISSSLWFPSTLFSATFQFFPREHSATLGDFNSPCLPWGVEHPGQEDTWSGLIKETQYLPNPQSWTWRVDTNDPRFFYCSAKESCTRWGMVFAVNPNTQQTFDEYQKRAKEQPYEMSPGQTPPPEHGGDTSDDATSTPPKKSLSTGAIVGIVIGGIAAVALVGILFFLVGRSRRKSDAEKAAAEAAAAAAAAAATQPLDAGRVQSYYGDHPPPGYDTRFSTFTPAPQGWEATKAPLPPTSPNPSQYNPHASMFGAPAPSGGHTSWAASELPGQSVVPQRVEIYTPGVDDRIPLNNPPRSP
ncbi:hypothetical protein BDZ91DRAFT_758926 [Kalaharituber pfeilii]|nr:hypothetical protein BDZ91DRAFT_758926 [Kalaharituber pfeilii]